MGRRLAAIAISATLVAVPFGVRAETLAGALARAYVNNPELNAQRAGVRATDENVPRARSGYRPRVTASGDIGAQIIDSRIPTSAGVSTNTRRDFPRGAALTVDQTLYSGGRVGNSVRQAESQVLQARQTLRSLEQTILFSAAQAYMDVLRDTAELNLRNNNVEVLEEQLRQTRDRFNVGEVTRTDVAQSEARLALAKSEVSLAEGNLKASLAAYRRVVGVEPRQLAPGKSIEPMLPGTLDQALKVSIAEHPQIVAAFHAVDVAELAVKITEGELYPTVGVRGTLSQRYETSVPNDQRTSASVVAQLTVPIYEGGEVYARVRQSKETLGQRRLEADLARDQVRAQVVSAWGALEARKAQIIAATAQVEASSIALAGVREEAKVGQRTTLDVLNAQQELLNARVTLIRAQRDRVVASYAVLQAVGRLSASRLKLNVAQYRPETHYKQVRDKWGGKRTPDGR